MKNSDLRYLKEAFLKYTNPFVLNNDKQTNPFILKKEHTYRVCDEIKRLSKVLLLSDEKIILAEAAALLHDIGRFKQYKEYGTFLDVKSVNHAELGCEIIKDEQILDFCTEKDRKILLNSVFFHNVFALPAQMDEASLLLLKLLRDADKLDIWKVVTDHYLSTDPDSSKFISMDLGDDGSFSKEVVECLISGKVVQNKLVKGLNDLKLLQISWVFGLNFSESIKRIDEKGYLEKIFSTLPASEEFEKVGKHVKAYIKKRTA